MHSCPPTSGDSRGQRLGWTEVIGQRHGRLGRTVGERIAGGNSPSEKSWSVHLPQSAQERIDRVISWTVFLAFLVIMLLKAPGLDYFLSGRDHGYQLGIGSQILLGKVPGIDIITAYGPMAMYTSALGLWLSDSLIGETIICAAGHSLALFLIYQLVRNDSSRQAGLMAAGCGFLLQTRFYKWYVWLIPLATLWALQRYLSSPDQQRGRRAAACGLVVGVGWLYRLDMGTLEFAASLGIIALIETVRRPRDLGRAFVNLGLFVAAFSLVPLAWPGYLVIRVGSHAPLDYLRLTITGALSVSRGMALPLPSIASVVLGYVMVPTTLLIGVGTGLYRELVGRADARGRFLLASGLVGLAVFHQAMHRMGPGHLLQVVSPAIVCAFVTLALFRQRFAGSFVSRASKLTFGAVGLAYFLLLASCGSGLAQWGCQDLASFSLWPEQRYCELAHPLDAPDRFPAVKAMRVIREQTKPWESILVYPLDSQFYALSKRKLSGRLHAYYAGVLDGPRHRSENLAAICREMPALVVLPSSVEQKPPRNGWEELEWRSRQAHGYLEDFIRERFTRVVYDDGQIRLLAN